MTLKKQFLTLVLGIILIPIIVMGISFTLFNKTKYESDPRDVSKEFFKKVDAISSYNELKSITQNVEEFYIPIVLPTSETQNLESTIIIDSKSYKLDDGSEFTLLLTVKALNENSRIFSFIFLFSSIIPLILLPLLIIRSINRSISKLEEATRYIASGDLEYKIDLKQKDKLGSLADSLNSMRVQIKSEKDKRYRFFMGVSHDLMTPLTNISGYSRALLDGLSTEKEITDKYLKIIIDKSSLMEQRIDQLLSYIKTNNQALTGFIEGTDLSIFLEQYFTSQSQEFSLYNNKLTWKIDLKPEIIDINRGLLTRVIENIVQNGFKYSQTGVHIDVYKKNDQILINIKNYGEPIPKDQLELIFEPFYQVDEARTSPGFGLGLSTVKSIASSQDWTIDVSSDSNETSFIIKIKGCKV